MRPVDELTSPKILIVQSAVDEEWGAELAHSLANILRLPADQIRFRSVGPLELPPTSQHGDQLKREAQGVPVVIAVLSDTTLATPLEMFELGATWAANASNAETLFIPILIRGNGPVHVPAIHELSTGVAPLDAAQLEDLVGQIAGSLGIIPANLGAHRGRLVQLAAPRPRNRTSNRLGKHKPAVWLTAAAVAGIALVGITTLLGRQSSPVPVAERIGFEEATATWSIASSPSGQGFTNATRSTRSHLGSHSLKVDVALTAADPRAHTGEALFDLRKSIGVNSADLAGRSITAWVYAPAGSAGEASKPNGLQLVLKDRNWKSQYGTWNNVTEGRWTKLTLPVDSAEAVAHIDQGFQSNAIVSIGVKMSLGEGSKADYGGAIYIDSIDW